MKNSKSYIMATYGERKIEFAYGKGPYLFSLDKKKYLDFGSGIAVNSLGHSNKEIIQALNKQSKKLWHTSNLYLNSNQEKYAENLCLNSFADKVFFTNSGTESIECGLKIIRSFHKFHNNKLKKNIITFEGAFHGRTYGAMSAQNNKKYSKLFEPMMKGFVTIPFNNIKELEKNINETTAAIMLEPIQGEGGVRPFSLKFLKKAKNLCEKNNILFFLDEVQSGLGRSGKLFSYEWSNIEPDIMALAKGIGSGFPMGACLASKKSCVGMTKGAHGSTFGGNALAMAVGSKVLSIILKKGFLKNVDKVSRYLWDQLKKIESDFNEILEVRGAGLLLGIKTKSKNLKIIDLFFQNGLITLPCSDNIVRLAPPLTITNKEVDKAIKIIKNTLEKL